MNKRGVKIVVSTGRIYASARKNIETLGLDTPIISCNGALIRKDNEYFYKCEIPRQSLEEALQLLVYYNDIYYRMYGDNVYYSKELTRSVQDFVDWNNQQRPEEQVRGKDIWRPLDIAKEEEDIFKMFIVQYEEQKHRYDQLIEQLNQLNGVYCVSSMPKSMDVINEKVNKGHALEQMAKQYQIDLKILWP